MYRFPRHHSMILLVIVGIVVSTLLASAPLRANTLAQSKPEERPCLVPPEPKPPCPDCAERMEYERHQQKRLAQRCPPPTATAALTASTVVQIGGSVSNVVVANSYAYVSVGSTLKVISIANQAQPQVVGEIAAANIIETLVAVGNYVYLAIGSGGLQIVDVTTPTNPVVAGSYDTPGYTDDLVVAGTYAYLADSSALRIVQVSNPTAPSEVGSYIPANGNFIYAISPYNNMMILATYNGIEIIGFANGLNQPTKISEYTFSYGLIQDVVVADNYAYLTSGYYRSLYILDLSDPLNIVVANTYTVNNNAYQHDLAILGNRIYFVGEGILTILDRTDPIQLSTVQTYDSLGYIESLTIGDNNLYVADQDAFRIVGTVDLSVVGTWESRLPTYVHSLTVVGSYAYMAEGAAGLRIYATNAQRQLQRISTTRTPNYANRVLVVGNRAYVLDGGVAIINLATPAAPQLLSYYDTPGYANDIQVIGNYAVVADGSAGVCILNIADPANPSIVSRFQGLDYVSRVFVRDNLIYAVSAFSGLSIINMADPANPYELGFYDMSDPVYGNDPIYGAFVDQQTYVASYGVIRVLDTSQPKKPAILGEYQAATQKYNFTIANGVVYITDIYGVRALNVDNPSNIRELGFYSVNGYIEDVTQSGGYIYTAAAYGGLAIAQAYSHTLGVKIYLPAVQRLNLPIACNDNENTTPSNDTVLGAGLLNPNQPCVGSFADDEEGLDDNYSIQLAAGQTITIDLAQPILDQATASPDYDLILYRKQPDGNITEVKNSRTAVMNERLTHTPERGGTFFIRVNLYKKSANVANTYTLNASTNALACGDSEPNDTFDTASLLQTATNWCVGALEHAATGEQGTSIDYYKLNVSANQLVSTQIEPTLAGAVVDFYLYDQYHQLLGSSVNSATSNERLLVHTNNATFARIAPNQLLSSATNSYRLNVTSFGRACNDVEPNNVFTMTSPLITDGQPCFGDFEGSDAITQALDFYNVSLIAGQSLQVTLDGMPSGSDYDLALVDTNGNWLTSSGYFGLRRDQITYVSAAGGSYTLRVNSYRRTSRAPNTYTLTATVN